MGERLYLSTAKLETFPSHTHGRGTWSGDAELVPKPKLAIHRQAAEHSTEDQEQKLQRVLRDLRSRSIDFFDSSVKTSSWVHFTLPMGWGTSHEDSATSGLDDILLVAGTVEAPPDQDRPVGLLLCGSPQHVLRNTGSSGRMGSGTRWLYDVIIAVEEADTRQEPELPIALQANELAKPRMNSPDDIARRVHDIVLGNHPSHHHDRLTGIARVLFNADDPRYLSRLVVATPLLVEYALPSARRRFRLTRKR